MPKLRCPRRFAGLGHQPERRFDPRPAATVKADEVVMVTTSVCLHCASAKGWLAGHGFAFTEGNMSVDSSCEAEARALGADGTQYLLIRRLGRTQAMKNGFDSDEFLAAVRG